MNSAVPPRLKHGLTEAFSLTPPPGFLHHSTDLLKMRWENWKYCSFARDVRIYGIPKAIDKQRWLYYNESTRERMFDIEQSEEDRA